MQDLKQTGWMWAKAILFLFIGLSTTALILFEFGTCRLAVLLVLAIWSFCRAYYFAFYVIQHYVDPCYRFSGLFAFLSWMLRGKRAGNKANKDHTTAAGAQKSGRPH